MATAEQEDVPIELRAIARVEAYRSVTVKPQVTGQITAIHFDEGQDVSEGDLLFSIDPRPFEAVLRQAEAVLARDTALADDAVSEAKRQTELHEQGDAAQREYETALAQGAALRATVAADRAAVEEARLNLAYCSILAPITGRTGSRLLDMGGVVKANEAELVTLNQLNPIYVAFSIPEQHLDEVRRRQAERPLPVEAQIPQSPRPPEVGELTFIDNRVDRTTGMILLKGTFPNESRRLWPGQFVNAILTLYVQRDAVVVPAQAVQIGQKGEFVYVVRADSTVAIRPVTPGAARAGRTTIAEGLQPGERVVTDGQLRLIAGAKVQAKAGSPASAPASRPAEATRP